MDPSTALRPLKHYADFRGRSTRTELILFYVLVLFAQMVLFWPIVLIGVEAGRWVQGGLLLLLLCPAAALAVRRLHDTGRSGWWLLLGLPTVAVNILEWGRLFRHGPPTTPAVLPDPVDIAASLCSLALLVLLLWNDDPEPNGYGLNPRYDEPGPAP